MPLIGNILLGTAVQTRGLEKGLAKAKARLVSFAATLAPIGASVAFTSLVRSGEEFNQAMLNSTAILGDVSDSLRGDMRDAAFEVAAATKFGATEAAKAFFYLESAGLSAEQSIASLPQVAAFAQAGNFDLAQATDLLTDAQSALGLTVEDTAQNMANMARVSDTLIKANTLANATAQQFSEALTNKAGAALRIVNKSVEEGVAVLAAFADQGIKGAEAGTALNIVLRDLQTKAIQNQAAFERYGITVFDSEGNMRNMAEVVRDVEKALDGLSDQQKKSTLLQLGFTDKSIAFLQTLIGTSDKIEKYQKQLEKAGGTTSDVADRQLTAFQKGMAEIGSALTEVGAALGEAFGPILQTMLSDVAKLVNLITGAFETYAGIVGAVNEAITFMTGGFFDLGKTLYRTIAILATIKLAMLAVAAAERAIAVGSAIVQGLAGPAAWAKMAAGAVAAAVAIGLIEKTMSGVVKESQKFSAASRQSAKDVRQFKQANEEAAKAAAELDEKLFGLAVPFEQAVASAEGLEHLPGKLNQISEILRKSPADRAEFALLPDEVEKFKQSIDGAILDLGKFTNATGILGDTAKSTRSALAQIGGAVRVLEGEAKALLAGFRAGEIEFVEFQRQLGEISAEFNKLFDKQGSQAATFRKRLERVIEVFGGMEQAVNFAVKATEKLKTPLDDYQSEAEKVAAAVDLGLVSAEQQTELLAMAAKTAAENIDLAAVNIKALPQPIQDALMAMQELERMEGLQEFANQVKDSIRTPVDEFISQKERLTEVFNEGLIDQNEFDSALAKAQDSIKQRLGIPVDPAEEFQNKLEELQSALASGIINQNEFDRALAALDSKAEEAAETRFAGALDARGSAARSVVLRNRFGQDKPLEAIADNGKQQLAEAKKQTGALETIAGKTPIKVFSLA